MYKAMIAIALLIAGSLAHADSMTRSEMDALARNPICVCSSASRTCTITGMVYAEDTERGLPQRLVVLRDMKTRQILARVRTDRDGYYAAENLPLPRDQGVTGWKIQEDVTFGSRPMAICGDGSVAIGQIQQGETK